MTSAMPALTGLSVLSPSAIPRTRRWDVVVKNQKGSVQAVVSSLRRRNLMVSFGVLVLLAVHHGLDCDWPQRQAGCPDATGFCRGVSHEVRTPLAAISSGRGNMPTAVVKDQHSWCAYGNSILKQSRQLTHLVEQVLLFAATQQSTRRYEVRPVDLGSD